MDKYGFLDFKEISKTPFEVVLKALGIPYRGENSKIITDNEIISTKENLYFHKNAGNGERKGGSVIQYVSHVKNFSLRDAAFFIKELSPGEEKTEKNIPVLNLVYHHYLSDMGVPEDLCAGLNVGYCEQKGIMKGRICFKVGEHYIGYSPDKKDWLFPKNFKRNTLWNLENCDQDIILVTHDPFVCLKLITKGYHYAASIMGSSPTEEQNEIIKRYEFAFIN